MHRYLAHVQESAAERDMSDWTVDMTWLAEYGYEVLEPDADVDPEDDENVNMEELRALVIERVELAPPEEPYNHLNDGEGHYRDEYGEDEYEDEDEDGNGEVDGDEHWMFGGADPDQFELASADEAAAEEGVTDSKEYIFSGEGEYGEGDDDDGDDSGGDGPADALYAAAAAAVAGSGAGSVGGHAERDHTAAMKQKPAKAQAGSQVKDEPKIEVKNEPESDVKDEVKPEEASGIKQEPEEPECSRSRKRKRKRNK